MKKHINTSEIMSELEGSVFFPAKADKSKQDHSPEPIENNDIASTPVTTQADKEVNQKDSNSASLLTSKQTPSQASIDASRQASKLAIKPDIIEIIRKIVKTPAKEEVLYVRVSKDEKNQLGDIEYTYGRQGIDTSANELGRIAVNFLTADYKANGENSILAKVLAALHA